MPKISDQQIRQYVIDCGTRQTPLLRRLREQTLALAEGHMMTTPAAGQLLALLARSIGARRVLEIGTFTGYSALCVADVLPEDGMLVACDASEEWTAIARSYWQEAGVDDRIDLRLGDATQTLEGILAEEGGAGFDFAFIDADKESYDAYYELCLKLVRPGGLICFDNMFWGRSVADPEDMRPETVALRDLNLKIQSDDRVDMSLVPLGDGMTFIRPRPRAVERAAVAGVAA
ncbi:class I SAM-dependent methyltransferase [Rhizobium cremeum]|uniref:O-methyltransferase n=1 Tax=Rhizobium cremeum TaxID=2813827 RepID=UPI001FD2DA8F|nr:class I SAM-dependent methyltransferase [Rhizobium cremeum]MCJ7995438.1 class I SAM-dependent methyltransferase [Rhizobium cremeum]MCJ8000936.1 class I SAM-dependent methyltransferase [Rhizobium cremeum]